MKSRALFLHLSHSYFQICILYCPPCQTAGTKICLRNKIAFISVETVFTTINRNANQYFQDFDFGFEKQTEGKNFKF